MKVSKVVEASVLVRRCFVCDYDRQRNVFEVKGWKIVECEQCKFRFVNPRYSDSDSHLIYDSGNWFEGVAADAGGRKNYADSEVGNIQRAKRNFEEIEKLSTKGSILDIGCGLGYILDIASNCGWTAHGIDTSSYAVDFCLSKGHSHVKLGTFGSNDYDVEQYNVVSAFDVFEHVTDPKNFLKDISRVLKQSGILVMAVPNVRCLSARLLGKGWSQYILPEHLNYFSKNTLIKILESNGFKIISIYSEPSISLGLRSFLRRRRVGGMFGKASRLVIDQITLFKRYIFYPPVNMIARMFGLEANLLVVFAKKSTGRGTQ
jgi:2-polyprenyl-3-methyl-5-hydroxy-6-metoxy-1,4-benzoquinol methylase